MVYDLLASSSAGCCRATPAHVGPCLLCRRLLRLLLLFSSSSSSSSGSSFTPPPPTHEHETPAAVGGTSKLGETGGRHWLRAECLPQRCRSSPVVERGEPRCAPLTSRVCIGQQRLLALLLPLPLLAGGPLPSSPALFPRPLKQVVAVVVCHVSQQILLARRLHLPPPPGLRVARQAPHHGGPSMSGRPCQRQSAAWLPRKLSPPRRLGTARARQGLNLHRGNH